MPDETQKERHAPHVLTTLAGVLIAFLLLAAIYVVYQAAHILFPQNVYETALPMASAFQRAPQWQKCTATLRRLRCACS